MRKTITVPGYCPTLKEDYSIDVTYELLPNGHQAVQVVADCEYASVIGNECPLQSKCPLRALAPKEVIL